MPIDPWVVNQINFESKMEKIEKRLNNAMTHFNERESESASLILELEKENKELNNELEKYKRALQNCDKENKELKQELYLLRPAKNLSVIESLKVDKQRLLEKLERYTEVLEFYAENENYEAWDEYKDATGYFNNVDFDSGDKAKNALGDK
jgi:chromosome segregation ATPase